ncbi:hypothetical protein J6X15_04705 [Candidatus Saccharibacteria bacterium]|nr:hypothetical protein [Candidatus Saccharibacteria bacterium]MBP5656851.1 hypothetical protein [Candidatus Saccharibacteria bacterium]
MKNTNYFGRFCRLAGRLSLFAGFVLCIGVGVLLIINPFMSEKISTKSTTVGTTAETSVSSGISHSFSTGLIQNQVVSWFITGVITLAAIIALAYLAKKYNATIRKIIANISKRTNSPIHMIELGLTLIVWSTLLIMLIFSLPLAASILIFPFIINELLFLFGWISYGMPDYKV